MWLSKGREESGPWCFKLVSMGRLLAASTGHQPGRALPREKGAECVEGSAGADPGLGERQHRRGDVASGDLTRNRPAPERGPIHRYGRVLTADEKARHVVLPSRGLVGRKREAEWVAQPAPGQFHFEIVGAYGLSVGAPWIA